MADNVWLGIAPAIAQVWKATCASHTAAQTFILTATAEDGTTTAAVTFVVTAGEDTDAKVATAVAAAWNASTAALHTGITATTNSAQVILTADTAGVPFYVAASGTGTWTGDGTTTANSGPSDFATAANWYTGAVPSGSDTVTVDGRADAPILYGLAQSGITLARLAIQDGAVQQIGQEVYPLRISATALVVDAISTINLHLGTAQTTARVISTQTATANGLPPVQIAGTHASNAITIESGYVGLGTAAPAQAYTFAVNVTGAAARVVLGSGGTVGTVNQSPAGGDITLRCAATTINQDGGTLTTEGSGAITTANIAGTLVANSTGTITTLNVQGSGLADFSANAAARTVTTINVKGPSARANFDNGASRSITWTNPLQLLAGARPSQVKTWSNIGIQHTAAI